AILLPKDSLTSAGHVLAATADVLAFSDACSARFHDQGPDYSRSCRGTGFWRFASASSTHSSNRASSKGLLKKSTAPAFIARSRTRSCGNAVIKMIGVVWPLATK